MTAHSTMKAADLTVVNPDPLDLMRLALAELDGVLKTLQKAEEAGQGTLGYCKANASHARDMLAREIEALRFWRHDLSTPYYGG